MGSYPNGEFWGSIIRLALPCGVVRKVCGGKIEGNIPARVFEEILSRRFSRYSPFPGTKVTGQVVKKKSI